MNVLIPFSSIKSMLNTNLPAHEFARYLTLSGPSVERIIKCANDYVLDIEVTTNRIDTACVVGIAQEGAAILESNNLNAKFRTNPLLNNKFSQYKFTNSKYIKPVVDSNLCYRFTACVVSISKNSKSPKELKKFLNKVGIRSINTVVDISNYLMIYFGQPVHMFDYDKVEKGTMIVRESKKGEKITLLDEKEYILPGGDIVIEDGGGKLIDLCGIMGGKNTEVDANTKRVILFVQSYNSQKIRRTSLITGARSIAGSYFEKGIDSQRVEPTFSHGLFLLKKYAGAVVLSELNDIYPLKPKQKIITINYKYINNYIGVLIKPKKIQQLLAFLGFEIKKSSNDLADVRVPWWRHEDISGPEDIVEEIARLYGYHNIEGRLSPFVFIHDNDVDKHNTVYEAEYAVKHYLANIGFFEMYNYSMYGNSEIGLSGFKKREHLVISNPISSEQKYMRRSLIPSLLNVVKKNIFEKDINIFEIANVYIPKKNDLPSENLKLSLVCKSEFRELKGYIENILDLLGIKNWWWIRKKNNSIYDKSAGLVIKGQNIGFVGCPNKNMIYKFSKDIVAAELDMIALAKHYTHIQPIGKPYSTPIIEDLTYKYQKGKEWSLVTKKLYKQFSFIDKIEFVDQYKNYITARIYSRPQSSTSRLNSIVSYMKNILGLELKTSKSFFNKEGRAS